MSEPRVLLYDIETSYIVAGVWRTYQTDTVCVLQDWQILCFAYKWLGDKSVKVVGQDDFAGYRPGKLNDKKLTRRLWELFDEADIVVAHNGIAFDDKKAYARMMVHGFEPPSPSLQFDTLREMKKVAAHTSYRLDSLNRALGLSRKVDNGGISTWTAIMEQGCPQAWKRMKRYNRQDVAALEELYLALRPWAKAHPPLNVISERADGCPRCLSTSLVIRGYKVTKTRRYRRFQCKSCGGFCSKPTADIVEHPQYA